MKIKLSKNTEITLLSTDEGKTCLSRDFLLSQICLLRLLAKIKFSRKFQDLQYQYPMCWLVYFYVTYQTTLGQGLPLTSQASRSSLSDSYGVTMSGSGFVNFGASSVSTIHISTMNT